MPARARLGFQGEHLAADLYQRLGYQIETRNFRCRSGEVDLIASNADTIVFCEVKTRRSASWGEPHEAVGPLKQLRVRRAATEWLRSHSAGGRALRFDVVSVIVAGVEPTVQHIPDAF